MRHSEWTRTSGDMAVAPGVVEITQHQRHVLPARLYRVPVNLEGAVRGRKHGRAPLCVPAEVRSSRKPYHSESSSRLLQGCGEPLEIASALVALLGGIPSVLPSGCRFNSASTTRCCASSADGAEPRYLMRSGVKRRAGVRGFTHEAHP